MNPLFSIIIPTYNVEKVIATCLDSITQQTFKNYEVVIMDGESVDNTLQVVKRFETKLTSIKIISKKDGGIYDAMNKGIGAANGEWLYFLGSDDLLYDEHVLENVSEFINNGEESDILYGDVYMEQYKRIYDGEFSFRKILDQNICHQAIFIKKSIFSNGFLFNTKYRALADWDHNIRWFLCPHILKKYINVTIAVFAHGGFSSRVRDSKFINEKTLIYLLSGKNVIDFKTRLKLLNSELNRSFEKNNKKYFLKLLVNYPRIFFGI